MCKPLKRHLSHRDFSDPELRWRAAAGLGSLDPGSAIDWIMDTEGNNIEYYILTPYENNILSLSIF